MSLINRIKSWVRTTSKKEAPLISVVLLLRKRIPLTDELLHQVIVRAWGRDFRKENKEYIVNKPPVCFLRFEDMIFMINNVGKPYVTQEYRQEQASQEFKEKRQLKAVMEHGAFFTIDLMEPRDPGRKIKRDCYRRMCSLAAEFVDENCMAASFPETGQLRPYDGELKSALQSEKPLKAIDQWKEVPVVMMKEGAEKLEAATQEARTRWPEFVEAFGKREVGQRFSVKAPFRDGEEVEWMWVTVSSITEEAVEGNLGNAPVSLHNIHGGDDVRIPVPSVVDWVYVIGDNVVGGFSLKVLSDG